MNATNNGIDIVKKVSKTQVRLYTARFVNRYTAVPTASDNSQNIVYAGTPPNRFGHQLREYRSNILVIRSNATAL